MKAIKGGKLTGKEDGGMLKMMADLINTGAPKIVQNTSGIKYSALLLDLIKPYHRDMTDRYELEYLLDMGVIAWNLVVYKQKNDMLYQAYLAAVNSSGEMDKESESLLKKLQKDKEKKFGQHDVLLKGFEIKVDKKGMATVNVISKPLDDMLQDVLSGDFMKNMPEEAEFDPEDDEDDDLPDYVLPVISRDAVLIKPKAPFYDWLRKISFPEEPPAKPEENTIYLLKEQETNKGVTKYLKKNFDRIFCSELWAWDMDESNWPKNRTYKQFTEWFEVEMHCMVHDLEKYPVNKE